MNRKYLLFSFISYLFVIFIFSSFIRAQTEKEGVSPKFLNHVPAKLKHVPDTKEHPRITDFKQLKLPGAIKNSNDQTANKLKEMSNNFNQLYNALSDNNSKNSGSGSEVKTECFDEPVPQCNYTWKEGELSFDVLDTWDAEYWTRYVYIDGQDGEHHYDDFWLENIVIKSDLTEYFFRYFQDENQNNDNVNPYPPEFGPNHDWQYEQNGNDQIYKSYNYIWSTVENDYIMDLGSNFVYHIDTSGNEELYAWSFNYHQTYIWYKCVWTNDYKYRWFTYDEDGNITDSGEGFW